MVPRICSVFATALAALWSVEHTVHVVSAARFDIVHAWHDQLKSESHEEHVVAPVSFMVIQDEHAKARKMAEVTLAIPFSALAAFLAMGPAACEIGAVSGGNLVGLPSEPELAG